MTKWGDKTTPLGEKPTPAKGGIKPPPGGIKPPRGSKMGKKGVGGGFIPHLGVVLYPRPPRKGLIAASTHGRLSHPPRKTCVCGCANWLHITFTRPRTASMVTPRGACTSLLPALRSTGCEKRWACMQVVQPCPFLIVGGRRQCLAFADRNVDVRSSVIGCLLHSLQTSFTRLYGSDLAHDLLNEFHCLLCLPFFPFCGILCKL